MDRRKSGAHDDGPRRPRRRAKEKQGGAALVILAIIGVIAVIVLFGAGAVGVVLYAKYANTRSPGPSGTPLGGASLAEKLSNRFVGKWEGDSPERPSVKVYLEITREHITMKAVNVRTNEWGETPVYSWRPVRAEGETLVVHREEVVGEKHHIEWSVAFASDDAMSVTSLRDGRLIANFRRVGKR